MVRQAAEHLHYMDMCASTSPQGYVPLGDAVVELLSPDSDKIIYNTIRILAETVPFQGSTG